MNKFITETKNSNNSGIIGIKIHGVKKQNIYYESHHIIPKCMGGIEEVLLTGKEHFILEASHPSGLSVYKTKQPFIYPGDEKSCNHFCMVNEYMRSHGRAEINWSIDE